VHDTLVGYGAALVVGLLLLLIRKDVSLTRLVMLALDEAAEALVVVGVLGVVTFKRAVIAAARRAFNR